MIEKFCTKPKIFSLPKDQFGTLKFFIFFETADFCVERGRTCKWVKEAQVTINMFHLESVRMCWIVVKCVGICWNVLERGGTC